MKKKIAELLAERVAPLVAVDKATVRVAHWDEERGHVSIALGGAYLGGPSRHIVLKYVIEPLLLDEFSEINKVDLSD